jgi:hypothetical protein
MLLPRLALPLVLKNYSQEWNGTLKTTLIE